MTCAFDDPIPKKVFFIFNRTQVLYTISDGKPSNSTQNEKFKDRVSCPPQEYSKGIFSFAVNDVQLDDSGLYECLSTNPQRLEKEELVVTGEGYPENFMEWLRKPYFGLVSLILNVIQFLALPVVIWACRRREDYNRVRILAVFGCLLHGSAESQV